MGDAKRRGTYEQRKAAAFLEVDGKRLRLGDTVEVEDKRMVVTELRRTGFSGRLVPPQES